MIMSVIIWNYLFFGKWGLFYRLAPLVLEHGHATALGFEKFPDAVSFTYHWGSASINAALYRNPELGVIC